MTVYVDDMYLSPIGQYGRMKMSHMMADTSEELLAMGEILGMRREWLQHAGTPKEHYDVSMTKRSEAIMRGAVAVTAEELSRWRIARCKAAVPACDCGADLDHADTCSYWQFVRARVAAALQDARSDEASK